MLQQRMSSVTYVGATGTPLLFEVRSVATGAIIDLSGYAITLRAKLGSMVKINAAAVTIETASDGTCKYTPLAAEIDTAGLMSAQLKLVAGGVTQFSEEFDIEVRTPV